MVGGRTSWDRRLREQLANELPTQQGSCFISWTSTGLRLKPLKPTYIDNILVEVIQLGIASTGLRLEKLSQSRMEARKPWENMDTFFWRRWRHDKVRERWRTAALENINL